RISQFNDPLYCVKYNIDDVFEKEISTEMRKWQQDEAQKGFLEETFMVLSGEQGE
ncbi:hypothetical protein HispidOSU_022065, partial [Sigmodon hispidus]